MCNVVYKINAKRPISKMCKIYEINAKRPGPSLAQALGCAVPGRPVHGSGLGPGLGRAVLHYLVYVRHIFGYYLVYFLVNLSEAAALNQICLTCTK